MAWLFLEYGSKLNIRSGGILIPEWLGLPVDHVHCFCRSLDLLLDSLSPDLEVLSRSRDFERVLERDFDLRCLVRRSISLKRCSVCRILRSIDLL